MKEIKTRLKDEVSDIPKSELLFSLRTQRELVVQLSSIDINFVLGLFIQECERLKSSDIEDTYRDVPSSHEKSSRAKVIRNLRSIAHLKSAVTSGVTFDIADRSFSLRKNSSHLSVEDHHHGNLESPSTEENPIYYVLDIMNSCLERNLSRIDILEEHIVVFLLDCLFGTNKEALDVVEIESLACLSQISKNSSKFDVLICSTLNDKWDSLIPVGFNINDKPDTVLLMLSRMQGLKFYPACSDHSSLILDKIWRVASIAEKSTIRTFLASSMYSIFSLMACAESGQVRKDWFKFISSGSSSGFQITSLMSDIHTKVSKWTKRDRFSLNIASQSLVSLSIQLQGQEYADMHMESFVDSVLKYLKFEGGPEREAAIDVLSKFFLGIQEKTVLENVPRYADMLEVTITTILLAIKRKSSLSKAESNMIVNIVSHFCNMTPSIFLPLVRSFSTDPKYGSEFNTLALELMERNIDAISKFRTEEEPIIRFVFEVLENLSSREQVRLALKIIPHLWNPDETRISKHFQIVFGLTRAKYLDISERAYEAIINYATIHPETCLILAISLLVEYCITILNDIPASSNESGDKEESTTDRLNVTLVSLIQIIEKHSAEPSKEFIIISSRWIALRQEVEALSILLFLRVLPSPCKLDNDPLWLRGMALRLLSSYSNSILRSYEDRHVGEKPLMLFDSLKDLLFEKSEVMENDSYYTNLSVDKWYRDLEHLSSEFWFEPLEALIAERWSKSSAVLLRVWRQLFVHYASLPDHVLANSAKEKNFSIESMTYVSWINNIRYMILLIPSAFKDQDKGLSSMETARFLHDLSSILFAHLHSKWDWDCSKLSQISQAIIWIFTKIDYPDAFEALCTALNQTLELTNREIQEESEAKKRSSSLISLSAHSQNVPIIIKNLRTLPFYTLILSRWMASITLTRPQEVIRKNVNIFKIYWKFFKYWMSRNKWQDVKNLKSNDSRTHIGIIIERFLAYTDVYAVSKMFEPRLKTNETVKFEDTDYLLNLRSYAPLIVSFCSFVKKVDDVSVVYMKDWDLISARILSCIVRCGPLDIETSTKNGQVSIPETIQLHILLLRLRGDHVKNLCQEAYVNLLKWNPHLLESYVNFAYFGWRPSSKLEIPSRWTSEKLAEMTKHMHVYAIAQNYSSHSTRWKQILCTPKLIHFLLTYQASMDLEIRKASLPIVKTLFNDKGKSLDLIESEILSDSLVSGRLKRLSNAFAHLYFETAFGDLLAVIQDNFANLNPDDQFYALESLIPWFERAKTELSTTTEFQPILEFIITMSTFTRAKHGLYLNVEKLFLSLLDIENSTSFEIVSNFVFEKMYKGKLDNDLILFQLSRNYFDHLVSLKTGKALVSNLVSKLNEFSLPNNNDTGKEILRIQTNHEDLFSKTDEVVYLLLNDICLHSSVEFLLPEIVKILHYNIVVFEVYPFGPYTDKSCLIFNMMNSIINLIDIADSEKLKLREFIRRYFAGDQVKLSEQEKRLVLGLIVSIVSKQMPSFSAKWAQVAFSWAILSRNSRVAVRSCDIYSKLIPTTNFKRISLLVALLHQSIKENSKEKAENILVIFETSLNEFMDTSDTIDADKFAEMSLLLISIGLDIRGNLRNIDFTGCGSRILRRVLKSQPEYPLIKTLRSQLESNGPNSNLDSFSIKLATRSIQMSMNKNVLLTDGSLILKQLSIYFARDTFLKQSDNIFIVAYLLVSLISCQLAFEDEDSMLNFGEVIENLLEWVGECSINPTYNDLLLPIASALTEQQSKYETFMKSQRNAEVLLQKKVIWNMDDFISDMIVSSHAIFSMKKNSSWCFECLKEVNVNMASIQTKIMDILSQLCFKILDLNGVEELPVRDYMNLDEFLNSFYQRNLADRTTERDIYLNRIIKASASGQTPSSAISISPFVPTPRTQSFSSVVTSPHTQIHQYDTQQTSLLSPNPMDSQFIGSRKFSVAGDTSKHLKQYSDLMSFAMKRRPQDINTGTSLDDETKEEDETGFSRTIQNYLQQLSLFSNVNSQ